MKEFKPRDKLTQRMTRDGAALDNQTTGEEIHISGRDSEKRLSPDEQLVQMDQRSVPLNPAEDVPKRRQKNHPQEQAKKPEQEPPQPQQANAEPFQPQGSRPISHIPQDIPTSAVPGGTAEKLFDRAAAEHDAHKARQTARMSRDAAQQRYSASRLQFSEEERAVPELHEHIHRAEKAADKLDAAQAAIPKKRVLRKERVFDEASGTAKTKLRFDTERQGLGTPATRAAMIEKLLSAGFVERKGKSLVPTKDGINLAVILPDMLKSPLLTAEWESRLTEIAKGSDDPQSFMQGIEDMTRELVKQYSHITEDGKKLFAPEKEAVGICPRCKSPVYEGKKNFYCSDRSCRFVMWKNDKFFESRRTVFSKKIAAALLKDGKAKVKGLYSERTGKTYDGTVLLCDTGEKYVNYRIEQRK